MDRYRLIMLGLGSLLVAAVALTWAFLPEGDPFEIPDQVERLAPGNGDQVPRQVPLTVDVEAGYTVRVFVPVADVWVEVPPEEMELGLASDGVFVFVPGPGRTIESWSPDQRVRVIIESTTGWSQMMDCSTSTENVSPTSAPMSAEIIVRMNGTCAKRSLACD